MPLMEWCSRWPADLRRPLRRRPLTEALIVNPMPTPYPVQVLVQKGPAVTQTISDTRRDLTGHVARFRNEGLDAEPVVFGDHRQPEAVLLPHATFQLLLDVAEDIAIAERLQERFAEDNGNRTTLAEAAATFGINLDEL